MKIEAVIFDWAGTTVDYGCFAPVKAFVEIFTEYGIEVTMDETRKPMGMLKWDHIKTMLEMPRIHEAWVHKYGREWTTADIDEMHDKFTTKLLSVLSQYTDVKPYVLETVKSIRGDNIKIGSTTGYTDKMMDIVVPEAKKKGYAPDYWISPNSVNNYGRPYPYMIFRNIEALHLQDVRQIIKVGDTISDIEEAKAAGVIAVGILEGSSLMGFSEEEYQNLKNDERMACLKKAENAYFVAGADYVLHHMGELPALISKIEQEL